MRDLVSLACGGEEAASSKKILRPHQAASLDMLRLSLGRGNRRVVLQAPTGFGKTVVSAAIMEGALRKGRSVLFTVPRIALVDQAVAECEGQGIGSIGVIQANHPRTDRYARVQVASVDTLARRDLPEKPGVVIVDECHFGSRVIPQLMAAWPDVHFIGMSATPWARGMGLIWQDLVVAATTASLIEAGFLSRFVVFAPDVPDLAGVKVARGDYTEQGLAEVMGDRKLVGHIAQTWLERGEDRPTLAFGVNCAHARQIAAEFDRAGVATAYCDAFTDRVERQHIERQFRAGDVRVVCSVRTLTTGVDWPVSCIIDAAPTQSEMLHVQRIGRGLRINPGSEDCIAADTVVLTDKGLCEIRHITLDQRVWDGVNFVRHQGAICKGARPVISYDGLTATPDHRVMTDDGWKTLAEAARSGLRIARTGFGRTPVRFVDDSLAAHRRDRAQSCGRGRVPGLRSTANDAIPQHEETTGPRWLLGVQAAAAGHRALLAISEVSRAERSLLQSAFDFLCEIWRARDRVSIRGPKCCGAMGGGQLGCVAPLNAVGSDRQRWALRARQSPVGASRAEHREQSEVQGVSGPVSRVPSIAPGSQVFRPLSGGHDPARDDGCRDCAEMGEVSGEQSYEEVWDILNAGPLQRFTANGRLVHNCVVLDHAGNSLRLGLVTDIHHETLDATQPGAKQPKKAPEKLPKPCAACGVLHTGRACPVCGKERKPISGVETVDGDLVEITGAKVPTMQDKQRFWSMALALDAKRGRGGRLAKGLYRGRFGVWPRGLDDRHVPPDGAFLRYEQSRRIAYAKKMAAGR